VPVSVQEKETMKKVFSFAVLAVATLCTVSAFAGEKTITLSAPTSINGQKLAAGEYKVKYQVNGSTAEVHFLKDNKEVATTSAQVAEMTNAPQRDSIVTSSNGDGTSKLMELQFAKQKSAIKFGSESSAGN
jgi:hypothetical protein